MLRVLMRIKTIDIDIPQIERRLAFCDPMRKCHARATAGLNADGVEARSNKHVSDFGCRTQNIFLIGGETFRTIEEFADADFTERRNALHRVFKIGAK